MSVTLRIVLIVVSVLNCAWTLWQIRAARVKIEDTVFWILFSAFLIVLSLFPGLTQWGAEQLGFQSPVNFIFLLIIFILLIKVFRMTIKISRLDSKIADFVQSYAIDKLEKKIPKSHTVISGKREE